MGESLADTIVLSGFRRAGTNRHSFSPVLQVEKEMADMVGQAEEKERRLNKSRKKLEKKLVRRVFAYSHASPVFVPKSR